MMNDLIWLKILYHMSSTYSIRSPASSPYNSQTLVAPSAATVYLGLIRKSCEIMGYEYTREIFFPELIASDFYVEPPPQVGISLQVLKAIKNNHQSLMYREFCHASGQLVIYVHIREKMKHTFKRLFNSINYWGRTDSFATCTKITETYKPNLTHVIKLFQEISIEQEVVDIETGIALQMVKENLNWEDLFDKTKVNDHPLRGWLESMHLEGALLPTYSNNLPCVASESALF